MENIGISIIVFIIKLLIEVIFDLQLEDLVLSSGFFYLLTLTLSKSFHFFELVSSSLQWGCLCVPASWSCMSTVIMGVKVLRMP